MHFVQSIVYVDWCLEGEQHPVVRLFGTTPSGQTSLIHLHHIFPYFYCDLIESVDGGEEAWVLKIRALLQSLLKKAIHAIYVVDNKVSLYGYQTARKLCKIELVDPNDIRSCFECLVNELRIRVYEAHVGFIPQVMADLNLYGMNQITCLGYSFRYPMPPKLQQACLGDGLVFWWENMTPPPKIRFAPPLHEAEFNHVGAYIARPGRTSICDLELDVSASEVLILHATSPPGSMANRNVSVVRSLLSWWDAEEIRRARLGLEFSLNPEPENSQPTFQCGDPFNHRGRLQADLEYSSQLAANDTPPQTQCSQDTLEVIQLLEGMKQHIPADEEFNPSHLGDEELLTSDGGMLQRDSLQEEDSEDDGEDNGAAWKDISQSQRLFLGEEEEEETEPLATQPTQSTLTGSKPGVELFYSQDKAGFVQMPPPDGLRGSTTSWFQPREPAPSSSAMGGKDSKRGHAVSQLSEGDSMPNTTQANPRTTAKGKAMRTAQEKDLQHGLSLFSLEVFARTDSHLLPNPERDAISAILYVFVRGGVEERGGLYVDDRPQMRKSAFERVSNEMELLRQLLRLVREKNPDVLLAWELQRESLGYILKRAKALGVQDFARKLSKVPFGPQDARHDRPSQLLEEHSGFWIPGRLVVNVWRLIRYELKLSLYSLNNTLLHTTGEKFPALSQLDMNQWFDLTTTPHKREMLLAHLVNRARATLRIVDYINLFGRGSEVCRFLGLDLFSSLVRGSQYQVESLLLRVCHEQDYVMLSPTREQVAQQRAMEACPLIFEPESRFYADPVCVFDFRSLYPSVIIAHNICFSTCLGRVNLNADGGFLVPGLGVDPLYQSATFTRAEVGFIAPNGVCFVTKETRAGILPRVLDEILKTRVMIKQSVVGGEADLARKRLIEARQYGLKMIANLTYGYTAASFSGRMPCVEVAETIVETGRAALEFAVGQVSSQNNGMRVVYGDTDSMFVHMVGKDLSQARRLGASLAKSISSAFPRPMRLQFEKVYFPCVLQVKKRYVGLRFSPDEGQDERGALDAKGIEIVRRDGCPALVKTMELVLKELFLSRDLSKVKLVLLTQLDRVFQGSVSLQDFVLTGKVKFGSYAKDRKQVGNYPPAAVVGDKMFSRDAQAKPLYKQRVPYLVACGPPQSRLVDLVVDPLELLRLDLKVNLAHYIFKVILPAVNRILIVCLGGDSAQLSAWYGNLQRTRNLWGGFRQLHGQGNHPPGHLAKLFSTQQACVLCGRPSVANRVLCASCGSDPQRARCAGEYLSKQTVAVASQCLQICAGCVLRTSTETVSGSNFQVYELGNGVCVNLDCEDLYSRFRALDRVQKTLPLFDQINH
ncbi:hypothetical protein BASA81_002458 [Batrachochytrium salamandrivorans]|nr:hypothetical protein BASA81_002458 [Batrachochytrium salamandrivorans]